MGFSRLDHTPSHNLVEHIEASIKKANDPHFFDSGNVCLFIYNTFGGTGPVGVHKSIIEWEISDSRVKSGQFLVVGSGD